MSRGLSVSLGQIEVGRGSGVGQHGYRGCLGRGEEVTDRFLSVVAQLLSSKGLFYLITIADNDPEEIIRLLDMWFEGRVVLVDQSWK